MRKTLLASLMVVCLSGCSAHYGQIACETIVVVENDRMVFKDSHGEDFDRVNEFISAAGDIIYTDYVPYSYLWRQGNNHPEKLKVYATKDSEEYVEYEFYSDIGPIGYTKNCYVDLKSSIPTWLCHIPSSARWKGPRKHMNAPKNATTISSIPALFT